MPLATDILERAKSTKALIAEMPVKTLQEVLPITSSRVLTASQYSFSEKPVSGLKDSSRGGLELEELEYEERLDWVFGKVVSQKNGKMIAKAGDSSFLRSNDRVLKWKAEAIASLTGVRPMKSPLALWLRFYAGSMARFDMDNALSTVQDVFKAAGIVTDDDIFNIQDVHLSLEGFRQREPRCEVILLSLPPTRIDHHVHRLTKAGKPALIELAENLGMSQAALKRLLWAELMEDPFSPYPDSLNTNTH